MNKNEFIRIKYQFYDNMSPWEIDVLQSKNSSLSNVLGDETTFQNDVSSGMTQFATYTRSP